MRHRSSIRAARQVVDPRGALLGQGLRHGPRLPLLRQLLLQPLDLGLFAGWQRGVRSGQVARFRGLFLVHPGL